MSTHIMISEEYSYSHWNPGY